MNKFVTLTAMCLVAIAALAQEKADIEVSYIFDYPNYRTGIREIQNKYILLSNGRKSKFYSPMTEYVDSIKSTPEGEAHYNKLGFMAFSNGKSNSIPTPDGSFYITKDFPSRKLIHYDKAGSSRYCYEDGINGVAWEICDSTRNILGYDCTLATGEFHGRIWNAWFTPEIPIQDGPWKLDGLPGLILDAQTQDGAYGFQATGIQHSSKMITGIYLIREYEKTSRKKFWKARRAVIDNPFGEIFNRFGGKLKVENAQGSDISNERIYLKREEIDFIETDY